jgi:hypothetical protein
MVHNMPRSYVGGERCDMERFAVDDSSDGPCIMQKHKRKMSLRPLCGLEPPAECKEFVSLRSFK